MTKRAQSKLWQLQDWDDGSKRSYAEPTVVDPEPNPVPVFPRVASVWIGGPQNYQLTSFQQGAAKFDLVVWNQWETWEQDRNGYTFATACANVKTINSKTKIFQYVISEAPVTLGLESMRPKLDSVIKAQNWFARSSWPSGAILSSGEFGTYCANVTNACKNILNGQNFHQWFAGTYIRDMYVNGSGLYSGAHAANPYLDGVFFDNVWANPRSEVDWNCDGTPDTFGSALSEIWRQGYRQAALSFKATLPNLKLIGNNFEYSYYDTPSWVPYPDPIVQGVYDGGMSENLTGASYSPENFRTGIALLEGMAKNAAMVADPTLQLVNAWRPKNSTTTNYQDFRHFFALTLCGSDGYVAYSDFYESYGSTNGSDGTARWFDEYDNAGTQKYYLGTAIDARVTGQWKDGIFRRRFKNGWVIWNPRGNGVKTNVSLGQTMRKIQGRTGYSDTTVNNGASVTQITLQDRDGLVLLNPPVSTAVFPRVAAYAIAGPHAHHLAVTREALATMDLVVMNQWETWESDRGGYTFSAACADLKSRNPNIKLFQYANSYEQVDPGLESMRPYLHSVLNNRNWYVRSSYPNGQRLQFFGTWWVGLVHPTAPLLQNGKPFLEWWFSEYLPGMYINGAFSQHAANPNLDGFFIDNVFMYARRGNGNLIGDWNADGTPDSENLDQTIQFRQAHRNGIDAGRATLPSHLFIANSFDHSFNNNPLNIPYPEHIVQGRYQGGLLETLAGEPWSIEESGNVSAILNGAAKHRTWNSDESYHIIDCNRHHSLNNDLNAAHFRDFRHAFCMMTCVTNGYVGFNSKIPTGATNVDQVLMRYDEKDNAGAQKYYLGVAEDSPLPATASPWQSGVYRRRFANGWVLWNPKGNGTQTLSLGQTMRKIQGRTGYSDTTVNNGASVTQITLQDRDGLVLLNP
jgi:hypothetical protein